MAGEDRSAARAVGFERRLELDVTEFHPFQAMRWLESVYEDCRPFGTAVRPADEPVRFEQVPSMTFAGSTLATFQGRRQGKPARLATYGFGLFGPHGPLPLYLTEYVRNLQRSGDRTFKRFMDVFHHRMIALFYRAWANAQPTVSLDRPAQDRFRLYVGALAGYADTRRGADAVLPETIRHHYAGHYGCQSRHADGLERVLSDYFDVPMRIEQFVGHWVDLPEQSKWNLGSSPETGTLGSTIALGEQVFVRQDRFRIVAGPLNEADYLRLTPGSESIDRMIELVRSYVGDEFSWELQLVLKKDQVQSTCLGGRTQLGMNTWLLSRPLERDPADAVMEPMRFASRTATAGGV